MTTLGSSTSVSADHIGRPSLYDPGLISHASEVIRILDALEAPSKRARFARRLGILCVLALLGITVFLFAGKQFGFQSIEKNRLLAFIQQMTGRSETAPSAQPEALPNEVAQDSSHQRTADSGNDAAAPVSPSDTEYPVSSETAADDTAEIIESALGAAMPEFEPGAHAEVDKPDASVKSHNTLQPARRAKSAKDPAAPPPKAIPLPSARAAGKSADKDVELIVALLSHVGRENAAARNTGNRGEMHGRPRAGAPAMVKNSSVDFNRDIVLRTSGESTNSLLKKCDALGFFEGQLCRLRICSGLWGKEDACPAGVVAERDG